MYVWTAYYATIHFSYWPSLATFEFGVTDKLGRFMEANDLTVGQYKHAEVF